MIIHYVQHEPFEGPAHIATWAKAKGHTLRGAHVYADEDLPDAKEVDWLILMGGAMSVNDEDKLPWLPAEKALIRDVINSGKRVLGICLGAQLIANALGAAVTRMPHKEIGWFPVRLTGAGKSSPLFAGFPPGFTAFHWHGETFTLPDGAVRAASSAACINQAFVYKDRVLGLQFHLEASAQSVADLLENCADELIPGPHVQGKDAIRAGAGHISTNCELMSRLLEQLERFP